MFSTKLSTISICLIFVYSSFQLVEALCQIMNDLFDNVIYAGIDTDKHKYPIGKFAT